MSEDNIDVDERRAAREAVKTPADAYRFVADTLRLTNREFVPVGLYGRGMAAAAKRIAETMDFLAEEAESRA